jgi:hypothetical protein
MDFREGVGDLKLTALDGWKKGKRLPSSLCGVEISLVVLSRKGSVKESYGGG